MMYTVSSIEGSFEALRSVSTVAHFTHFTVAHAHLGLYAFFSIVMFGAIYFVMPRVMSWEWPHPKLLIVHFWPVALGTGTYGVTLPIRGWLQGLAMLDATKPFIESVRVTMPCREGRALGGAMMTLGHLVFAAHFVLMALRYGTRRVGPALLHNRNSMPERQAIAGAASRK